MDLGKFLSWLPLWAVFVFTLAFFLVAVKAGTMLAGVALAYSKQKDPDAPLGTLVASILGLLGFFLAFTFGLTASRFDARRQLVLEESNAIGTTYLRAGLLPSTPGLEIRRLLREYAEVRVNPKFGNVGEMLKRCEEIHGHLWVQTKLLFQEDMDAELRSLFIISLNELIDLHQSRKTVGLQYRIPGSVWLVVYLLSGLSMLSLGYQIGMSGVQRLRGAAVLAVAFSMVITMIADIDRPGEGFMRVSQQPIADVQQMMLQDSP